MKKFIPLIFAAACIFFNLSCNKKTKDQVNQATEFDISYSTSLSVPSNTMSLNVPIDFTTPDVPTQSNQKFLDNKTAAELVDEIKFTKFNISAGGGNLDFLKSLSIYVKASGVGEQLVATKNPVPTGASSISLDLTDVNIKTFIIQPNIQFRVTVTIDGSTLNGQNLSLDETVHVKATVLK
jgi:hypothetical protein